MGTRSVVAVPTADGWRGRYVHWDGYPSGVGRALVLIVARDGLERARRVLTEEHYGWSSLSSKREQHLSPGLTDGRFVTVPGYGVAYTYTEQPDVWITPTGDDWGTEWCYVLGDDSVTVYSREWGSDDAGSASVEWREVGTVAYGPADATMMATLDTP